MRCRIEVLSSSPWRWQSTDVAILYRSLGGMLPVALDDVEPEFAMAMAQAYNNWLADFHLTGITLALGPSLLATAHKATQLAKSAGWQLSFDVNYRRQLWSPAEALKGCDVVVQAADILFVPRGDACTLYGFDATMEPEQMLAALAERYPQATIVMTLGVDGAIGCEPQGTPVRQAAFPAQEVGRLGGGDAFAAGFLYRYLTVPQAAPRLPQALQWGAAAAALKYSILGDIPLIDRQEVEALLAQGAGGPTLRR